MLDFSALAKIGTLLDQAHISTINDHALITAQGAYAQVIQEENRWTRTPTGISMSMRSGFPGASVLTPGNLAQRQPDALHVFDSYGHVQHRLELINACDALAFSRLARNPQKPQFKPTKHSDNVVLLEPVRTWRKRWDREQREWHHNQLLRDGGITRRRALPHMGVERARRLIPEVLEPFLRFLQHEHIAHCRGVLGESLLQSDSDTVQEIQSEGEVILLRSEQSLMAVERASIGELWETRYFDGIDMASNLEIYTPTGRCIAVLWPHRRRTRAYWNDLVMSLPAQ